MTSTNPLRIDRDVQIVPVGEHQVAVAYDPDGERWYVQASSVPGLAAQADSLDDLLEALPGLVRLAAMP